jgi:hypothetical protein
VSGRIRTSPSSRYSVLAEDPNHDRVRNIGVLRAFYRALRWRKLLSGDDAWTGFLLDTAFAAAVAAGATPVAEATDRSWGGRSAFMAGRLPDPLF